MKVCAIIAEYNPFHCGHFFHLQKIKKLFDSVVVILSGHLTQRGEFSIFNKWTRTKMALLNGADLVLEMPSIFSCSCAEKFSHAAIKIIKELGFVTNIDFGSEIGEIEKIVELAKICRNIEKTKSMKIFLKQGFSYPKAKQLTIGQNAEILKFPNNTLSVEYVKFDFIF